MAVQAYICFNGNCREAVEFYTQVFATESQQIMNYGDLPPDPENAIPEKAANLILHTWLNINGSKVMFSDTYPSMPFIAGNNISLTIVSTNLDEMRSTFDKLKVGGSVAMDLQETFWSKCYGMVTDKFGIPWQFSYAG